MSANSGPQDVVSVKIDQLMRSHEKMSNRLENFDNQLLDRNDGLFVRVREIDVHLENMYDAQREAKNDIDKLVDVCTSHETHMANLLKIFELHEMRDDDLRKKIVEITDKIYKITSSIEPLTHDFVARQGRKRWTDKLMWLVIAAVVAALIPTLKVVVSDVQVDRQRVDKLEELLRRDRASQEKQGMLQEKFMLDTSTQKSE